MHRLGLLLVLLGALLIRLPLLAVPLERDEGECAYIAQWLGQGLVPYRDAVNAKPPGMFLLYWGAFRLFGESTVGLHLGLACYTLAMIAMLYRVGLEWRSPRVGLLAAAIAAVLMAEPTANGQAAHAEPLYHLPSVTGIWCLLRALRLGVSRPSSLVPRPSSDVSRWWFAAGLCHGLAGLIKQVVVPQAVWVAVLAAWSGWRGGGVRRAARDVVSLLLGIALPWVVAAAALWRVGALADAVYWMFGYIAEFIHSPLTWRMGLRHAGERLLIAGRSDGLLWLAALVGAAGVWRRPRDGGGWVFGWLAVSIVAMTPGKFFLPHYFLLPAPPLALLAAEGMSVLVDRVLARWSGTGGRVAAWGIVVALVGSPLAVHAETLRLSPEAMVARIYPGNPFAEAETLGQYLAERTDPSETILIVGNEPEILFHARRRSSTRFVFFYPLAGWSPRSETWRQALLAEIEPARPRYVVWMNLLSSFWMVAPPMDRRVLDRLQPWASRHYGLEAALVWRGTQPYALVSATRIADLGGAQVVALVFRRME